MKRKILWDTLKKDRNLWLLFGFMTGIDLSLFLLYGVMIEPFLYAAVIIFVFTLFLFLIDCIRNLKKADELENLKYAVINENDPLPSTDTFEETQYHEMINSLTKKINTMNLTSSKEREEMQDWYTLWVHQIKTPIAVLKLKVPEGEREIRNQLFRIEEYADMALSYIRLGSEQNDLVIKEYPLDGLIRETLRKYAFQFIAKRIKLIYQPTDKKVITDKKWFLCILEQYISNAVKYTEGGTVTLSVDGDTLIVSDTGIGIAKEDLPRIFEKGFTGHNGRSNAKSSGLGLYLSQKAAKLINVTLSAESTPGEGSRFLILFPRNQEYNGLYRKKGSSSNDKTVLIKDLYLNMRK